MLAKFIREQRKKRNLTQEFLASALKISRPTYMQIEQGERDLTITEAKKLAEVFDIQFDNFLEGKGNAKNYINLPNSVSDLSKYDNGGTTKPQAGDILVFDGISTDEKLKYGHVSIIREVGNDYVKLTLPSYFK